MYFRLSHIKLKRRSYLMESEAIFWGVYSCQRCGTEFIDGGKLTAEEIVKFVENGMLLPLQYRTHICEDSETGLAKIIGWRGEKGEMYSFLRLATMVHFAATETS
jgi:hypothetical protein